MSQAGGGWTLCIDFGTAYSKAAAAPSDAWARFDPGLVRPLMLGEQEGEGNVFLLDSAVFVDDERVLFGPAAIARAEALTHKKRLALRSFKTLLSVSDLERALNTSAPTAIDPHRIFTMRDLIVLYLAYLLAAIERAVSADPDLSEGAFDERRYAAPAWRSGDSAGLHGVVVELFGEAEALAAREGEQLLAPQGLALAKVQSALLAAQANPQRAEMGLIFEATAAAAYSSIGLERSASHMIVVDVGAGTTDIAAMSRAGARVKELPQARVTLKQAGDFIDGVIANLVLEASPSLKTPAQQAELWSTLMRHMRDIKESVFLDGRAVLRHERRTLEIKLSDLDRDKEFHDFTLDLAHAYDHSLEVVCKHAMAEGRREIQAIAVGGGSGAPFVQDLMRRKPAGVRKVKIVGRPATPEWAHTSAFAGNLAPVFPQLAIAIGGALAPEEMLAVRAKA
jgi:molecular chaperone DnaK (HSP70)